MVKNKIKFVHSNLFKSKSKINIELYKSYVNPLNYDFGLTTGDFYFLLGIQSRSGSIWLYVADEHGDVSFVPAVLFEMPLSAFSKDFSFEINGEDIYLARNELFEIQSWYEKYLNDDISVMEKINKLIS